MDLYVAPYGSDKWSGRLPEPNTERTDGPLATISRARDVIRELRGSGRLRVWRSIASVGDFPITVWVRGGRYQISEPIVFGPEDSAPVTYAAYPGEKPVIDGGKQIQGWRIEEKDGMEVWVADVPEVAEGKWCFHQLFINGERRPRARLPKRGFYRIKEVKHVGDLYTTFQCETGEIQRWKNLTDVEVVVLHLWIEERLPIVSFQEESNLVRVSRNIRRVWGSLRDIEGARYYVENVFEALSEPGEWYLDRTAGKIYYVPMPGEEPDEIKAFAPVTEQLLRIVGKPEEGEYVEFLRFEGLTFRHTRWDYPAEIANQAAHNVPGAIYMEGARYCVIEDCKIEHIGGYGIELSDGCVGNQIISNEIYDVGAGGIKLNGSDVNGPPSKRTGNNRITDNHIYAGGRVFHSAVGILSMHSFGNEISHNHIHDFYYTGISCGWVWGYGDNISKDNRIEKNYIHDIGQGLLDDMGGIYMLGVQPGTVIRGNVIHDVVKHNYGGWGIYLDEGSSHMLVENNICYNTHSGGFMQHYGRENIIRNNILAFGKEGQVCHGRADAHKAFTFERNIVITDNQPLFIDDYAAPLEKCNFISDLNLFWDISGKPFISGKISHDAEGRMVLTNTITMDEWRKLGQDRHSIIADPRFKDLRKFDFTLMEDSPALNLGFQPIDSSDVGPRPKNKRR